MSEETCEPDDAVTDQSENSGDLQIDFPVLSAAPDAVSEVVVTTVANDVADEDSEKPPELEAIIEPGKRRGRPRKRENDDKDADLKFDEQEKAESSRSAPKKQRKAKIPPLTEHERAMMAPSVQLAHVKMFENEVDVTPDGDCYATLLPGCQIYLMRKDRIIKLLTDETEIELIKQGGWMLEKPPRLPPLVTRKACFAFYVDGSKIHSVKEISNDDLKPWSSSREQFKDTSVKPNVRRHPVGTVDGQLQVLRTGTSLAEMHLTEYSAYLPRLLRLKKKIYYLSNNGQVHGNILILYEYMSPGEAPTVVKFPRGVASGVAIEPAGNSEIVGEEEPSLTDPFEEEVIDGPSGGVFLRVKPSHIGWLCNQTELLRYLINEPEIMEKTNCLNKTIPYMPPLIETTGMFVHFVAANFVASQINIERDGLSPWSQRRMPGQPYAPRVKTTRKGLLKDENGQFTIAKEANSWTTCPFTLTENVSVLARCQRLRKRVIYIQQENAVVIGNVCYVYEYLRDGPIPEPMSYTSNFTAPVYEEVVEEHEEAIEEQLQEQLEDEQVGEQMEEQIEEHMEEQIEVVDVMMDMEGMVGVPMLDGLQGGYDLEEFDEDPLVFVESASPFFDLPRQLSSGHFYLTVSDKKLSGGYAMILDWIINTTTVEDRGILNITKPPHPPLVHNDRAYAFFVASTAIIPHDINRDDFSPWSRNADNQNPTCFRTKVKKIGVVYDEDSTKFYVDTRENTAVKSFRHYPYHLVYLYSVHPRVSRLRKKVYYVMETTSRMVVSHTLILYDYKTCGEIPMLNSGIRYTPRASTRKSMEPHDVENDVEEVAEEDKTCPFVTPPCVGDDGSIYMKLSDMDFWNDRNRQLQFLVNKPELVESLHCLNPRIPSLPPMTPEKAAFVYFVDREEVADRLLTLDQLIPWSDSNGGRTNKRPKCTKSPLAFNRDQELRVWKTAPRSESSDYQLHTYMATLPRASRLRKKVAYVLKNGHPVGHALIIYNYTDAGSIVRPLPGSAESFANATARTFKSQMRVPEDAMKGMEIVEDSDLQVAHTEEVLIEETEYLERPVSAALLPIRLTQNQQSAIWRIVRNTLGASSEEETFDMLFRLLFERNEPRLLQNVSSVFGVEILPENEIVEEEEEEYIEEGEGVEIDEVVVELEGGDDDNLAEEDDIFFEQHY